MRIYNKTYFKYETNMEIKSYLDDFWRYYYEIDYDDFNDLHVDYGYLEDDINDSTIKIIQTRRGIPFEVTYMHRDFKKIDMESFYSKSTLRDKKIEKILSDIKDMPNTIENIISRKK